MVNSDKGITNFHVSSDITGVDLLASVRNSGAWVILNSSYLTDEYYEEYKKIDCRKYCISKPLNQFSVRTILDELVTQTTKNNSLGNSTEFIMVKQGDYLHKINIDSILYFESSGHLVYIKTKEAKYATYGSLKHYESLIQGKTFEKINKLIVGSSNGKMFSDPEFAVAYFKNGTSNIAKFTPKSAQLLKYIKQIELHFPKNQTTVSQVNMTEASGDTTNIVFKNTKINAPIPASEFSL